MTYNQFVELINMPSVLFLIGGITFILGFAVAALVDWLRS